LSGLYTGVDSNERYPVYALTDHITGHSNEINSIIVDSCAYRSSIIA